MSDGENEKLQYVLCCPVLSNEARASFATETPRAGGKIFIFLLKTQIFVETTENRIVNIFKDTALHAQRLLSKWHLKLSKKKSPIR